MPGVSVGGCMIKNFLKFFCFLFFMIMGIFFIMMLILVSLDIPVTLGRTLLVLAVSALLEYGYVMWVKVDEYA